MDEKIITLGDEKYPFFETMLPQASLKFYIENPRVYSYFDRSDKEPTQEEIESVMCDMDSVRVLRDAIKSTRGLVQPLIVIEKRNEVIEGNRRLAAYRLLASKDPVNWSKVWCMVLPSNISEKAIFILLGQYHLHGQLSWAPFELAGYIYRRIEKTKVEPEAVAKELARTPGEIKQYYKVYKFMLDNNDLDAKNWSHYEEYLKTQSIKKRRASHPDLDSAVVKAIKSGAIKDARIDVRDKLGFITKLPEDQCDEKLKSFIAGEMTLNECYKEARIVGKDILNDLVLFRTLISTPETMSVVRSLSDADKGKYRFELNQIKVKSERLVEMINQPKNIIQTKES